ncbi:MAG: type II toxin-antitoxin system VapC family toxin [Acidobacteriia bacterium]|nr:type II toxin-antitoxin system VapC family toxin [Terriglobia bacterium]
MARIFWDTNLFIYLFENNAEWSPRVVELRRKMLTRGDTLLTSWLTVGEVLTKPKQLGNAILEKSYLNLFSGGPIEMVSFEVEAAKRYGEIRSRERVRPADAMQLACAAAAGTDLFVTNDSRLSDVVVSGITFITGIARIPY